MQYIFIIFGVFLLLVYLIAKIDSINLNKKNASIIAKANQNLGFEKGKQAKISGKSAVNNLYNADLNLKMKNLSNEVLELHQDFLKTHSK